MGRWALLRAQIRADRAVLSLFALVVASVALLAVVVPDQVASTLDRAQVRAVTEAPLSGRELVVVDGEAALTYGELRTMQARAESLMPDALPHLRPAVQTASTEPLVLHDQQDRPAQALPAKLAVRFQSGLLEQARFVAGRAPAATAPGSPIEVAVAASAAQDLGLAVGDTAGLRPETVAAIPTSPTELRPVVLGPTRIVVSGLFEPAAPSSDAWTTAAQVLVTAVEVDRVGDPAGRTGTVLTASSAVDRLARDVGALSYGLRYALDPATFDAAGTGAVEAALTEAADDISFSPAQVAPRPFAAGAGTARASTAAPATLAAFRAAAADARALAGLVLGGVVALALLSGALVVRIGADGRASVLALVRARGASRGAPAVMAAAQAAVVAVPAALAGQLAGSALVGEAPRLAWRPLTALSGVAVALVYGAVAASRTDGQGPSRWRSAVTLGTVAVAALALYSLRRRGVTGPDAGAGTDWLLVATPTLLAVAAGLLTAAAYRYPVGLAARLSARSRGAMAHVALSRARRDGPAAALVLTSLVMAVALSVYALVVSAALSGAHRQGAWAAVGADYRLDALRFDAAALSRLAAVEGVTGAAAAAVFDARAGGDDGTTADVRVVAVDTRQHLSAFAGRAGAPAGLAPLAHASGLRAFGSPASVSLARGGQLRVSLGDGPPVAVAVTPLSEDQAALAAAGRASPAATASLLRRTSGGTAVLLVDMPGLQRAAGTTFETNRLFVAAGPGLRRALAAAAPGRTALQDRRAVQDDLAGAPLTAGIRSALLLAVLAAAAYGLLLFVAGLALTAPARGQDLSRLRTLGSTGRQAMTLLAWEVWPKAVVGTCAGLLSGLALARLVAPAVDLAPYTGGATVPALALHATSAAAAGGGAAAVAATAVLITRLLDRRRDIGAALRLGAP